MSTRAKAFAAEARVTGRVFCAVGQHRVLPEQIVRSVARSSCKACEAKWTKPQTVRS